VAGHRTRTAIHAALRCEVDVLQPCAMCNHMGAVRLALDAVACQVFVWA